MADKSMAEVEHAPIGAKSAPRAVSNRLYLPADQMAASAGQQIPSLNGLRAVSVMIVLFSHFVSDKIFPGGLGVTVFFVISGFLITRLLLAEGKKTGRISLPKFYIRRAVRILPVIYCYVFFILLLYFFTNSVIGWVETAGVLFDFANYVYAPMGGSAPLGQSTFSMDYFVPMWSLSVEEHFYFLLPAALIFLKRRPGRLLMLMGAICVACLAYRILMASLFPALLNTHFFYYRTECRLDSLAYGVALAALCELPWGARLLQRLANPVTLAVGVATVLLSLIVRDDFFRETVRYSLQGLAISAVICAIVFRDGWIPKLLNLPVVDYVGILSYSLYIWSMMAAGLINFFRFPHTVAIVAAFILAFSLAFASYRLLEKPLVNLRHRLGAAAAPA